MPWVSSVTTLNEMCETFKIDMNVNLFRYFHETQSNAYWQAVRNHGSRSVTWANLDGLRNAGEIEVLSFGDGAVRTNSGNEIINISDVDKNSFRR